MASKRMPDVRTNPYPTVSAEPMYEIHANKQTAMFRASPWVPYDPTPTDQEMDQDVDMEAPQISILRDDNSPPPVQSSSVSTKKVKKPKKEPPTWSRPRPHGSHTDDEYDEVDEPEEDQLIDDDDMNPITPAALSASARSTETKKKTPSKRKPRKSEKVASGHDVPPTMSWFEANPDGLAEGSSIPPTPSQVGEASDVSKPATPVKVHKKPGPKSKKDKAPVKAKSVLPILADDVDMGSEAGFTGTAASSPVTAPFEPNSPEPEGVEPLPPPVEETINLENVPLPVYPLPSKPFPVQPPPKIQSGFAPATPLDKSGKKVRHWRVAQREIRGIAGGRWFVRSWVGEHESELAVVLASTKADEKSAKPGLGGSISAPIGGKGSGKKSKAASLVASAAPSRSSSSVPDAPPPAMRAPTKMRNIIGPPSEAGDSDAGVSVPPSISTA